MKKIFNSKLISIIILIVAVCTVLTACMGTPQVQEVSKTVSNYDSAVNSLNQDALNNIATKLYNNAEARDAFLAAFRGYAFFSFVSPAR